MSSEVKKATGVKALGQSVCFCVVLAVMAGLSGFSADAAVSVVTYGRSAPSGTPFNLTVPAGSSANGVVVIVHCTAVLLAAENVNVTVGGAAADPIQGGDILHNGNDADVQIETFYCAGNWAGGATIPINWTWVGATPTDYVIGAYALRGVSAADWPFQAVKFRSDPILANPRSVLLPSINTAINGSLVLWSYSSDQPNDTTPTANPALSGGTITTAWEVSDGGSGNRIRAESWFGIATNSSNSEILGTTTTAGSNSRIVMVGMSMLPIPPSVVSIVRADSDPTSAGTVTFTVTFSEPVTGVGVNDFALSVSGVTGASIAGVSADTGAIRTVTVNTGNGSGTIRLDVVDDDSIINAEENPLGGPGTVVTGNGSFSSGEVYTVDKTPPEVTSVLRAVASPTNWDSVTYFVSFSEFVTGVEVNDFVLTTSGITGASVESVWPDGLGAWRLVTVRTGSGSGTLRLDVVADGSIADGLSTPLAEPFSTGEEYEIDKVPPTGTISIDDGLYPPSDDVTLTLSATDANGVVGMRFSPDGSLWSLEEAYATSKAWTLSPGDGVKTVYVQYKDAMGNWSTAPISAQAIRDTTPPTGTIAIATGGYSNTTSVNLILSASDANGVARMQFSNDNVDWSPDEVYATSKAWNLVPGDDGPRTVYVRYQDNAGLWSTDTISLNIMLDRVAPTADLIEINGGSEFCMSTDVILAMQASDDNVVGSMRFSNNGVTWNPEQAYDTSAPWTLSPGDELKTVYAQFKDSAGNWSGVISDTISLDTTPPAKPVMTPAPPTTNQRPTWSWTSGGGGSGVYQYDLDTSGTWTETTDTSFTPEADLPEGNHRLVVRERDAAGNWSATSFFDIFVDLTNPVVTFNPLGLINDTTPAFTGSVGDNLAIASVVVAIVDGNTYTGTFGGGTWIAQVPNDQPLVGAPPTSYIADVTATDTAGRTATARIYFAIDSTVETQVSYVATADASFTNASQVVFDVVFSLGVRWVTVNDFALTTTGVSGASIVNVAGIADSDTWAVTVNTGTGEGTIRLDVVDWDTIIDIYNHPLGGIGIGNGNYSSGGVYTIDKTPPTVILSSSATTPNNFASIPVVATFNEDIPEWFAGQPNFVESDVTLENATLSDFEMTSPRVFHFNVHPVADGEVSVRLDAGVAKDQAGNGNTATGSLLFQSDRTVPVPSVTGPGVATHVSPIVFTINFPEPVTGLTEAGISVIGGTKGALSGSGAGPYTLPVTPPADGPVTCQVLAGVVRDAAQNANPTSDPVTVSLDRVAPSPTVTGPASPTNAYPIDFVINFDEPVADFDADDVTVTNGTKGSFSGSGAGPYTMPVYPDSEGAVTCRVAAGAVDDLAGNPCLASNVLSIVWIQGALPVTIEPPSVPLTRNGPVSFVVTYTGAANITLSASDVTLNATGTAAGLVSVSGTGTETRTVTIDTLSGTGTLGININGGTASDLAGNLAAAAGPSDTFMVDNTPPVVTINPLGVTNNTTPTISGTADDNVGVAAVTVTVEGNTYTATLNDIWWNAKVSDALAPGDHLASVEATDTVGNKTTQTMLFTVDPNAVTTVEAVLLTGPSPTNADTVDFLVIFSGDVSPVVAADFALHTTGGIAGAAILDVTGAGSTRTVTVSTGSGDGTIRLDVIDRDTILDAGLEPLGGPGLGNGNYTLGQAYTIDRTIPYATLTLTSPAQTGTDVIAFKVVFSEPVTPAFDASKVALQGTLGGIVSITGSSPVYNVYVILADPNLDGTVGISVGQGLTDTAGTPCVVSFSQTCYVYNWREPYFAVQPASARSYTGSAHTFTVAANCGATLMNYQWKRDNHAAKAVQNVGENSPNYTIPSLTQGDVADYWCEVTYDGVKRVSATASLQVAEPLQLVGPANRTAVVGGSCLFSVSATGGYPPLTYAWKKVGGTNILGAGPTLTLVSLTFDDAGSYQVEVEDDNGMVAVNSASLTVTETGLPVAGAIGLGLMACGLALGGLLATRRRK